MFNGYQYRPLCEITFLHSYFLNNGEADFDSLSTAEKKVALKRYHYNEVFDILPLGDTASKLKNHRILQMSVQHGLRLSIRTKNEDGEPLILPADDEFFVYAVRIKDANFLKYTDSGISSDRLYFFTNNQPDRLKDNDGISVDLADTSVELLPRMDDSDLITDDFILSEEDTAIVKENYLTIPNKTGIIGLIYIRIKSSDTDSSTMNADDETKDDFPNFKLHFGNLETYWKYKRDSISFEAETTDKKGLSKYGFVEIDPETDFTVTYATTDPEYDYKYPNPIPGDIEIQPASGSDPEKIYSVIYI